MKKIKNNKIKLYHYSDQDIKTIITPNTFGKNYYTKNDIKASNIKRAFYYLGKGKVEYSFKNSKYLYITEVNRNILYDLDIDKAKLKDRFKIKRLDIIDITKLLKYIKKQYAGAVYNDNIAIIFKDLKYNRKIRRRV